jgi:serine/threonine-protein kinase RsbW
MSCAMQSEPSEPRAVRLVFDSDPMAVRTALRSLFEGRPLRFLSEDDRGTAEIVLSEALNNIVEHAYAAHQGRIEVSVRVVRGALICTVVDQGLPMPGESLPEGRLPDVRGVEDLPEGGFGWHLIRALSSDLAYRRVNGRNELRFRLITATA